MTKTISFQNVSKMYRRGSERANLRAALPGRWGQTAAQHGHAALQDITLDIHAGERVAIIGANGAGKTTLLKLVAKVTAPTTGNVVTRGKIASLIELGIGFHPDLTGTENVRFAAAVLGMSQKELGERFGDIVAFAGIKQFMDTPVKRYSTGMLARLGFAVASHLDADILAVDEVLAVGDAEFQSRAYERMTSLEKSGKTLMFVTHSLWLVPEVCERAIWLENGRVLADGDARDVVNRYKASAYNKTIAPAPIGTQARVSDLRPLTPRVLPGQSMELIVEIEVVEPILAGRVILAIERPDGLICASSEVPQATLGLRRAGNIHIQGTLKGIPLLAGTYQLRVSISETIESGGLIVHGQESFQFEIEGVIDPGQSYGFVDLNTDWQVKSTSAPRKTPFDGQ